MEDRAPSASLRLLQRILEVAPGGRVFTSRDAIAAGEELGLSPGHTYKLLTDLVDKGLLERPRGRLYVMQPPFGGLMPVRPLAIAVRAVTPAAVSGETALVHWGFLSQAPLHEEVVSTPVHIQWRGRVRTDGPDRLWIIDGTTIRFRRVPQEEMFGITTVRLDSETVVPMFDRERTVLEVLTRPEPGSAEWAGELIRDHRPTLDRARLTEYAARLGAKKQLAQVSTRRSARARAVSAS
jgi:predicted transcriptional regulator of viral defense system